MSNGADIYTTTIYDFSFNHSSIEKEGILSIHELRYYPFAFNLDRWAGICNTLNNLSTRVCVPNFQMKQNI